MEYHQEPRRLRSCKPCHKAALVVMIVFLIVLVVLSTVLGLRYRSKKVECSKRVEKDADENNQTINNVGFNMAIGSWRLARSKTLRTGTNDGRAYYLSLMGNSCTIMSYGAESTKPVIEVQTAHKGLQSLTFDKSRMVFTFTIALDNPLTFDSSIPALNTKQLNCEIRTDSTIPLLLLGSPELPNHISFFKKLPENTY